MENNVFFLLLNHRKSQYHKITEQCYRFFVYSSMELIFAPLIHHEVFSVCPEKWNLTSAMIHYNLTFAYLMLLETSLLVSRFVQLTYSSSLLHGSSTLEEIGRPWRCSRCRTWGPRGMCRARGYPRTPATRGQWWGQSLARGQAPRTGGWCP